MSADQTEPSDSAAQETAPQESVAEENKRKFREALEAKRGRQGEDHLDNGQHSTAHAHGKVETKRVFRRKTG